MRAQMVVAIALLLLAVGPAAADQSDEPRPSWFGPAANSALHAPRSLHSRQMTPPVIPQTEHAADSTGLIGSYQPAGPTKTKTNAFFQALGSNDRTCFTCHQPQQGWSFTPLGARLRFAISDGTDPLFRPVDGANCPDDDVSNAEAQLGAHSLLLNRGLIRIFLPFPDGQDGRPSAQFTVSKVNDPYDCTSDPAYGLTSSSSGLMSMYRRPLPSTNTIFADIEQFPPDCPGNLVGSIAASSNQLKLTATPPASLFVGEPVVVVGAGPTPPINTLGARVVTIDASTDTVTLSAAATISVSDARVGIGQGCDNIMWDGREPSLQSQFIDATLIHDQTTVRPTEEQIEQGVLFQDGIYTAQVHDFEAGKLDALGATGGPTYLPQQFPDEFTNDVSSPFDMFNVWAALTGNGYVDRKRASIARGGLIFTTKQFNIAGVAGFNEQLAPPLGPVQGACARCHDVNDVGNTILTGNRDDAHPNRGGGETGVMDTGVGDSSAMPHPGNLPLYTFTCTSGFACPPGAPNQACFDSAGNPKLTCTAASPCLIGTDDPGAGLITGKCIDLSKFKVPVLRGLAARAPYFHDGSAATLMDVVNFYDRRFGIGLSAQEKQDLVNFLGAL